MSLGPQGSTLVADEDLEITDAFAFHRIGKSSLMDKRGVDFATFRKTLRPNFLQIWIEIGLGLFCLALVPCLLARLEHRHMGYAAVLALPAAALIGYIVAYVNLFFHEAAHYNIAANRKWNDRLANLFIGTLVGQAISQYRVIHFDHHRHLGTTRDTERSYFDALTPQFLLESLFGIRVLKVVLVRQRAARLSHEETGDVPEKGMINSQLLAGLALHFSILIALIVYQRWFTALAWVVGVTVIYPFCNAVRQVLEHRSESAEKDVDYSRVDHGAYNRIFGDGPFAATFGGAGFNRHLLHHWEPQISYTCLKQVELYLLDTEAAPALQRHRTSYSKTFGALFGASSHGAAE